ncbi:MAG: DNA polymerase I [Clostridiales Family XIII bacterium]|jgi:DNA polymerase-1|nr:DNA polymerase I [Clostridiales Family XIII bacterium]
MENRIIIIDGNSLVNRAYYAIQRPMITREGVYTQGIYGFLTMFFKLMRDYEPGYLAVAFDRKAPTFRHEAYAEYKAGRKKMPEELVMQLPPLKELLDAMHVKVLEIDGFEADDIIGAVAKKAEDFGLETLIITGDKDALQLAGKTVKVLITKRGISEFELYDEAAMHARYGFGPERFVDFKGLMGDQSDNLPGVPGVGEKTAQKLIREFGSVENVLANLDRIPSENLRTRLSENAVQARMSRKLAEIITAVPIDIDFDALRVTPPDNERLAELYTRLEFKTFLRKLKLPPPAQTFAQETARTPDTAAPGSGGGAAPDGALRPAKPVARVCMIKTERDVAAFEQAAAAAEYALIHSFGDKSHVRKPQVYGISVLLADTCFYLPLDNASAAVRASLFKALAAPRRGVAGHNLAGELYALRALDAHYAPLVYFDTAVGQYLLEPTRSKYAVEDLLPEYFRENLPDEATFLGESKQLDMLSDADEQYAAYGAAWCSAVDRLIGVIGARLEEEGLAGVFESAELPLIPVLSDMEAAGFSIDRDELMRAGVALTADIEALTERIHEAAGESFNIKSPAQIGVILFEKLGLPASKMTKVGYATGADILEKLRDKHPIVDLILAYRMLTKLNSTYVEGLLPLIGGDGRIHPHFRQTVTATGRISCTGPNLQNIPIRQELGRTLRRAFVPESADFLLVGADYSQIELRVLAHLTQDPALMDDFRQGADIHRRTAARVFGFSEDAVTPLLRSRAKAVNFGVIYGMSGFGLSEELGIGRKEAEQYIAEYFKTHAAVKDFMDGQIQYCRKHGYVLTVLGRKRRIPEINASVYMARQLGERLAMNTPIQGSAADIIKLAMIRVADALRAAKLRSRLILQVHDELIIEARTDEIDAVKTLLRENMEQAFSLRVPLTVELNTGANWYDLK